MKKPKKLSPGDMVAILAPSSAAGHFFPHRIERASAWLRSQGFKVLLMPTATGKAGYSSGTVSGRVRDLHDAFSNPEVRGIITTIGGITSNELLNHLDYELIARNPKVLTGYSDNTLLLQALHLRAGLVGFYGPAAMTQFAEYPAPLEYTVDYFRRVTGEARALGGIRPSPLWTEEFMDWGRNDASRPRQLQKAPGWTWVREGKASGQLTGGCLPSLLQLMGTPFQPAFAGRLLFIESPEGEVYSRPSPLDFVYSQYTDLKNCGVFEEVAGLIIGRPYGYNAEERREYEEIVRSQVAGYKFPVLLNADFGHTDPVLTLPIGVISTLDSSSDQWSIDEAGVE